MFMDELNKIDKAIDEQVKLIALSRDLVEKLPDLPFISEQSFDDMRDIGVDEHEIDRVKTGLVQCAITRDNLTKISKRDILAAQKEINELNNKKLTIQADMSSSKNSPHVLH